MRLRRCIYNLLIGSVLLVAGGCASSSRHLAPADPTVPGIDHGIAVETAMAMVGAPYRYGGASPRGFDCSGLVVYSFAQAGVTGLPRSAKDLMHHTHRVDVDELAPGDLLFFDVGRGKISHVGIFVADRTFVHAPSSGKSVSLASLEDHYWRRHFEVAGRLLR